MPRGLKADDCCERYWHAINRFTKALLVPTAFALGVFLWWKANYPTHASPPVLEKMKVKPVSEAEPKEERT